MHTSLNEVQLAVLRWVADDRPPGIYDDGFAHRITARALERRGLVKVRGHGDSWTATVTNSGRYYIEHGRYESDETAGSTNPAPPTAQKRPVKASLRPRSSEPRPDAVPVDVHPEIPASTPPKPRRPVIDETIPIPVEIGRAHPAIRELVKYKKRLDVPEEERQRALLILHALAQESLRRGWAVTPQLSTMTPATFYTTRKREWPSSDLFLIDAGHEPAAIRLRMKTRRVDHVLTEKELADKQRGGYFWAPKSDFVPTDKMRLEIGAGHYGSLVLEDTVATRIEDKLLRAIIRIQQMSDDAVARAEAQRLRAIEAEQARQRTEALRRRGRNYGHWLQVLESLRKDVEHHQRLVPVVAGLREALPSREGSEHYDALVEYVEWAEEHLVASDPFRLIPLPNGDRPDLTYLEWREWDAQNPQRW